jgi:SAM-dependent methyltransferase
MKLSELVNFRNRLNELSVDEINSLAHSKLDIVMHLIENESSVDQLIQPFIEPLLLRQRDIHNTFIQFGNEVDQIKKLIDNQIAEQEKYWFQESYKLFEEAELCETTDQILYGRTVTGDKSEKTLQAEETLRARLSSYANWKFPGMIIRPGIEDFVDTMVGCDPLYIIDREHDLLRPCLDRFPNLYQNRLRPYTTNDWSDSPILEKIPNNQFGVCLAYKVFDYRPLEIIRRYLEEIYQKLRPGGVLLMSFNDCDNHRAVMLVEQFCASYTPGYLIRDLVQDIGFKQVYTWDDGGPSVWLELHKPGQLTSKRGGQVIASVCHINDYSDDVDYRIRRVYTEDEIAKLQETANTLNIDRKIIKRVTPYELEMEINAVLKEQHELEQIENQKKKFELLKQKADKFGIDIKNSEVEELVRIAELKNAAIKHSIDVDHPDWEDRFNRLLRKREEDRSNAEEIERRVAAETERQRVEKLKEHSRSLGIDPDKYPNEAELIRCIAKTVDQLKKDELKLLRQRATELQVGDPTLIRYGYSAEKLKQLIKAKEERQ